MGARCDMRSNAHMALFCPAVADASRQGRTRARSGRGLRTGRHAGPRRMIEPIPARRASVSLAKITRPKLHKVVPRTRLFDRLDGAARPLVWVVGPPGAGK